MWRWRIFLWFDIPSANAQGAAHQPYKNCDNAYNIPGNNNYLYIKEKENLDSPFPNFNNMKNTLEFKFFDEFSNAV